MSSKQKDKELPKKKKMSAWYTIEEIKEDTQKYSFFQEKIKFMISGFGGLFNKKIFPPQIMMILFAFLLVFNFLFRLSFFSQISWVYSVRCGDRDIFPPLINGL